MHSILSILSLSTRKTILITGCDTYPGYSIALELLRHKGKTFSDVYLTYYKETQLIHLLKQKGAHAIRLAASDRSAIVSAYHKADIVVVVPPVSDEQFMHGGTEVFVDAAGEANVSGLVVCTKLNIEQLAELPALKPIKAYEDAYERTKGKVKYASLVRCPLHLDMLWLVRQQIAVEHKLRLPVDPQAKFTAIIEADGARALYNILVDEKFKPGTYELTGSEVLTFSHVARAASEVFGRAIEYAKVGKQELIEYLSKRSEVSENEAIFVVDMLEAVSRGYLSAKNNTLKDMLGKDPMDFVSYLEHNAKDFRPKTK
ncbi:hypothetical protein FBU59_002936 [Linderina macrospora]|uniref:Uncharacterized protein n=1 Tax=Linderina macrospora TaxID=4868 RepID=A0ACC1JA28_9FUNG|nr:hypothetical protein FBU59_002936 [Linderina macrospora]